MKINLKNLLIKGYDETVFGVNYWSRHGGPFMWRPEYWNPKGIREEMKQIRNELGLDAIRAFIMTPDFFPRPNQLDRDYLRRLDEFVDIAGQENLGIWLSMVVGHMSGQTFDIPFRNGRDLITDPYMKVQMKIYFRDIVSRFPEKNAIKGWIISNEAAIYAGPQDFPEGEVFHCNRGLRETVKWCKEMASVIREADKEDRFVVIGDGVMGLGPEYRQDQLVKEKVIDFVGPHVYWWSSVENVDAIRHSTYIPYAAARTQAIAQLGKKEIVPVVGEEFGYTSAICSDENGGKFMRINYKALLLEGASAVLPWKFSEMDFPLQPPYNHQAWEIGFGITKSDGTIKLSGKELKRASRNRKEMEKEGLENLTLVKDDAYIIISSDYYHQHEFSWVDRDIMDNVLHETFTLTKLAGIAASFLAEPVPPYEPNIKELADTQRKIKEGKLKYSDLDPAEWGMINIPEDAKLLILPSMRKLGAPSWHRIKEFVENGGTFYCSYFNGPMTWHQGMGVPNGDFFKELFGFENDNMYGLPNLVKDIELLWQFGNLNYTPTSNNSGNSFCRLKPHSKDVEILATRDKEPAIVVHSLGKGKVIFSAFPIEYYLANTSTPYESSKDRTHLLYERIAKMAGIEKRIETNNHFVQAGHISTKDSRTHYISLVNHSWDEQSGTLEFPGLKNVQEIFNHETNQIISFENFEYTIAPKDYMELKVFSD